MSGMRLNALIEFCPKETIARSIRRRKSMMMNNGEDEAGRRQLLHLLRLLYPIQHVHYQWRQLWIAKRLGLQLEASIQTLHPSTWNTYSISVNRIVSLKMEHYKNTFRWTKYICPKGENISLGHGVWKSPKKSYSILRAKRATYTFWVDKLIENAKNGQFYQIGQYLLGQKLVKMP